MLPGERLTALLRIASIRRGCADVDRNAYNLGRELPTLNQPLERALRYWLHLSRSSLVAACPVVVFGLSSPPTSTSTLRLRAANETVFTSPRVGVSLFECKTSTKAKRPIRMKRAN